MTIDTLALAKPIRITIAEAGTPDKVSDVFCYVVGFLSSELKGRIYDHTKIIEGELTLSTEEGRTHLEAIASYVHQLAAVESAWDAYRTRLGTS